MEEGTRRKIRHNSNETLPTTASSCTNADTTAPSEDALRVGAKFIADQLQRHPGKRVYVHCKGGIARASTMALAHYILNKGQKADDAVELLKARRHVVMRNAADYSSVRALERSQAA